MFQIKCKDSDKTELIPAREAADKCHYSILAKFFDEELSDEERKSLRVGNHVGVPACSQPIIISESSVCVSHDRRKVC